MAVDLVIDIENEPGALARVAAAISDAGVNIAAATCIGQASGPKSTSSSRTLSLRGTRWRFRISLSPASGRSWWSMSRTALGCWRT